MICGILSGCTKKNVESAIEPVEPEKYISFQDYTVKEICINMWDTNGDGNLSEKEAVAVKSIGNVFTGKKIYRFDEFKYFTGVTEIPDEAFYYQEKTPNTGYGAHYYYFLKSITIPKNVRKIGENAISNDIGAKITFKSTTPPYIDACFTCGDDSGLVIYVPSNSYKTVGGNWQYYSNYIVFK